MRLETIQQSKQRVLINFYIEDSGIGIPEHQQVVIFEPFIRGEPANKGLYKGNGLGLKAVKRFIEEQGAEIDVKSEPHKGTTFTCTLAFKLPLINNNSGFDAVEEENISNI